MGYYKLLLVIDFYTVKPYITKQLIRF